MSKAGNRALTPIFSASTIRWHTAFPGQGDLIDAGFAVRTECACRYGARRREIDIAWVELALTRPERIEPDRLDRSLEHALVRISEHGDRVLRVVYNPSHKPPMVVTAYFDRKQRGKR